MTSPRGSSGRTLHLTLLAVIAAAACAQRPAPAPPSPLVVITGARAYPSPTAAPVDNALVLVEGGRIKTLRSDQGYRPPRDAQMIDARGKILTAGFWNSHVHFIEQHWEDAASAPADALAAHLRRMLVRHGFTSVVDTGSYWHVTDALRRRIEAGDIAGPRILTAGEILFPSNGAPPPQVFEGLSVMRGTMPEIGTPEEGAAAARAKCDQRVDLIKVYLATWWRQPAARLPVPTVQAVTAEARRCAKPVLAHPSDLAGIETAIAGGVDVVVHTTAAAGPWPNGLPARLRQRGIALVPTLKLWRAELVREGVPAEAADRIQRTAVEQLRAFVRAGGDVLFGTDVGYMQDDDPQEEYALMADAGMTGRQILASLTTAPAARFARGTQSGVVAPGEIADLVLLDGDPMDDVAAFARVTLVLRGGRVIYNAATR